MNKKQTKCNPFSHIFLATGWLATKVGGKYLFGAGILGTAVLTLITPPMTRLSIYLLIAVRVLEGLFEVGPPVTQNLKG